MTADDLDPRKRAVLAWQQALPTVAQPGIDDFRRAAREFGLGLPVGGDVVKEEVDFGEFPGLWVRRPGERDRVALYVHGGGFVMGEPAEFAGLAANVGRAGNADVLIPGYRLAPECSFPGAIEDVVRAYRGLVERVPATRVAILAESAGAAIALEALLRLRDEGDALAVSTVLFSPWVDLTLSGASMDANAATDSVISRDALAMMAMLYTGDADPAAPEVSPLFHDLTGLPPMLIQVGADECLVDDARRLAEHARRCGVTCTLEEEDHVPHVYQYFASFLPPALAAIERAGAFLQAHWTVGDETALPRKEDAPMTHKRVQEISADIRAEITALVLEHAWLADHDQHGDLADLYTDDGCFYGFERPLKGRTELRAWAAQRAKATDRINRHVVTNLRLVREDDDLIKGSANLLLFVSTRQQSTTIPTTITEYQDVYRRVADKWRFHERRASRILVAQPQAVADSND